MTDEQKRERMHEIDKIRDELKKERREYEQYFETMKRQQEREQRETYVGKCFLQRTTCYEHNDVIGFKVLGISEEISNPSAICIAIVSDCKSKLEGVVKKQISLWSHDVLTMMPMNTPKIIDYYNEVSEEEFNKVADKYRV